MIKVGIVGYGNLGKGVEAAISQNSDMELAGIFTRRDPGSISPLTPGVTAYSMAAMDELGEGIDVMILCGGSATDLPVMTPQIASKFNVIDSFDTHAKIPEHFDAVDRAARSAGKTAIISVGWDPGMFSLSRLYGNAILTEGTDYTFWGKGVSQGHSDAVRRIEGVLDARQYTIPVPEAVERVRKGENPSLTTREKHTREVFAVVSPDADKARIEKEIKEMPNYFSDYDTTVHFISQEELDRNHKGLPHGGSVIRTGRTGFDHENGHVIEYSLKLDSNPQFTGAVLTAFARAAYRMNESGQTGCKTVFDVPPALLVNMDHREIISHLL